jgi:hypothetical protein
MIVLIAKKNIPLFQELGIKKFTDSTVNTCTFRCTEKTFVRVRNEVRAKGFNPFSIMYW